MKLNDHFKESELLLFVWQWSRK